MNFHIKPTTFVSNVAVKVSNLEQSLVFYTEVLGFKVLNQTANAAELTADGKTNILTLVQPNNVLPKEQRRAGLYHFAILLPTPKDLANIVIQLREHGVQIGASDHLVSEALYIFDPDGNEIEIYIDRDPSVWQWSNDEVAMAVDPLNFERLMQHVEPGNFWKGMPEDAVMGHIHLHVSFLQDTEKFYTDGLGFDVVNRFGAQALFLSSNKYHHHIGVNTWNGEGAPHSSDNAVGLVSYTLMYNDAAAVQAVVENLNALGATVVTDNNQTVTIDPSGNRIILTY
ncbi:VOC family protein [Macrococcus animalis]|uniref:VOC family protein n=1 Tax=Macrococcus animalis TaxID=3395467 RepID=UPI0039BDFA64